MSESDVSAVAEVPTISIHRTVKRRHTPSSKLSHFSGTPQELVKLTATNFSKGKRGDFVGSLLVPVPPQGFFVRVSEKDPRVDPFKPAAKSVDIVLHNRERLEEDDKETLPEGIDWVIVSIHAYA